MSFSSRVKEELSYQTGSAMHCRIAEIAAILSMCGQIFQEEDGKVSIKIRVIRKGMLCMGQKSLRIYPKAFLLQSKIPQIHIFSYT